MLSQKDKKGVLLIVGATVIFLLIFMLKFSLDKKSKPGVDNCVGTPAGNTVIVLDYSEEIPVQTKNEIFARAMKHIAEHVKVNERVTVFKVSDSSQSSLTPVVSLCRPPDHGNRLIENTQAIGKQFKERFEKPLQAVLEAAPVDGKESPIAQTLTDIALSEYLSGDKPALLIFSDMLENTQKFSMYKCESPSNIMAVYRASRRGALERPQFSNANVEINLIPRIGQSEETLKCRDKFWPWFFGDNHGLMLSIRYLPGGAGHAQLSTGKSK